MSGKKKPEKKRILFVDDEPNVLEGLKRLLRAMRKEWDMDFATSGQAALEHMAALAKNEAAHQYDVVVADMRMPGMDGAQLLEEIQASYPSTIRIILSGHSEYRDILRSVKPTHQFLSKPCTAEELTFAIARARKLQETMLDGPIRKIITQIDALPSLPQVYQELEAELAKNEPSMDAVAQLVSQDVGMTASILKLVNSSFFGLPMRVTSPSQAVKLLGLETIRGLVLTLHLFSSFSAPAVKRFSLEACWHHSTITACMCKAIAEAEGTKADVQGECFIAGIVHDVGKLVLADKLPGRYGPALERMYAENMPLPEAEFSEFGTTHAEIGGYLLGLWGLSDAVVDAVFHHHKPSRTKLKGFSVLAALHVATYLEYEISNAGREEHPELHAPLDLDFLDDAGLIPKLDAWRDACEPFVETCPHD